MVFPGIVRFSPLSNRTSAWFYQFLITGSRTNTVTLMNASCAEVSEWWPVVIKTSRVRLCPLTPVRLVYSGGRIHNNCAFSDKFLKFCMHVGMGQRFSKLIASKLGSPSGGRYMQNPRWPPPRIVTDVSNWNLQPYTFVIPFFLGFQVWQIHFKAYLRYSWSF